MANEPESNAKIISSTYHADKAEFLYAGEVRTGPIFELVGLIDEAFDYYQYDKVVVLIDSLGGAASALTFFSERLRGWQRDGRFLKTRALTTCCSAAACMLSMGEFGTRTVMPFTVLVYHYSRTKLGETTASMALEFAKRTEEADGAMLQGLIHHVSRHFTGSNKELSNTQFANELLRRANCVVLWADKYDLKPGSHRRKVIDDQTEIAQKIAESSAPADLLAGHWDTIFQLDRPLHYALAYLFMLIDRVEGVDELKAPG